MHFSLPTKICFFAHKIQSLPRTPNLCPESQTPLIFAEIFSLRAFFTLKHLQFLLPWLLHVTHASAPPGQARAGQGTVRARQGRPGRRESAPGPARAP